MTKITTNIININELLEDEDRYFKFIEDEKINFMENYASKDDIITVIANNVSSEQKRSRVFIQIILLYPFIVNDQIDNIPNKFFIWDELSNFTGSVLAKFNDNLMGYFNSLDNINNSEVNRSIATVMEILSDFSGYTNILSGLTINLRDLLMLSNSNKKFNELLTYNIPTGIQFKELEDDINNKFDEAVDILQVEDTCYASYINARSGMNLKQLKEVIIAIGGKPDLKGNLISKPINSNFIYGLNNVTEFYILAEGSKKAIINNFNKVTESGYLTRKLSILNIDTVADLETDDCGSDEYIYIKMDNEKILNRYDLRYFLNDDGNLELLHKDTHKHLIGTTVRFRSPITCKGENGICKTCYGKLIKVNDNIHIGINGMIYITNQLTQSLLSTKHLLQANTDKINWCDNFNKYFSVDLDNVYIKKKVNGMRLLIDPNDLDVDESTNKSFITGFTILRGENETYINSPVKLYISDYLTKNIVNTVERDYLNRYVIDITRHSDETPIFTFIIQNNEITETLQDIISLIETNDMLGLTNIHDITNTFLELLNESNIHINGVHIEIILSNMVRDKNGITKKAKSIKDEDNDYEVLRVTSAIINSESPTKGLSFENQKNQLNDPSTYLKQGKSVMDYFFLI